MQRQAILHAKPAMLDKNLRKQILFAGIKDNLLQGSKKEDAMTNQQVDRYLPLTETTYYILLALNQPRHGYAVMQYAENLSGGHIKLGPGTLYGAITKLLKEKIITPSPASGENNQERRKVYRLTDLGRELLLAEYSRLQEMVRQGATCLNKREPD
jgi:DNA-binding PadR family transcriptional regulator